jgi:hypothetical protein
MAAAILNRDEDEASPKINASGISATERTASRDADEVNRGLRMHGQSLASARTWREFWRRLKRSIEILIAAHASTVGNPARSIAAKGAAAVGASQ